jgi:hypothetical protein
MTLSAKLEHALLEKDEIVLLRSTHHPEIYVLGRKQLVDTQSRLRMLRGKAKTLTRQKQREAKGKSEVRGRTFPGELHGPQRRKQLFASALKRVNKELHRLEKLEAKARHVDAAHQALSLLRDAKFVPTVRANSTPGTGMQVKESRRRRRVLARGKVGSVLKQNKIARAVRDAR